MKESFQRIVEWVKAHKLASLGILALLVGVGYYLYKKYGSATISAAGVDNSTGATDSGGGGSEGTPVTNPVTSLPESPTTPIDTTPIPDYPGGGGGGGANPPVVIGTYVPTSSPNQSVIPAASAAPVVGKSITSAMVGESIKASAVGTTRYGYQDLASLPSPNFNPVSAAPGVKQLAPVVGAPYTAATAKESEKAVAAGTTRHGYQD